MSYVRPPEPQLSRTAKLTICSGYRRFLNFRVPAINIVYWTNAIPRTRTSSYPHPVRVCLPRFAWAVTASIACPPHT